MIENDKYIIEKILNRLIVNKNNKFISLI
jgi:hypothetical protein